MIRWPQFRFQCTSSEVVDEYYDLFETVLTEFDLYRKPGSIYNVDETGMSLDPLKLKVVLRKARRRFDSMAAATNLTSLLSVPVVPQAISCHLLS